MVHALLVTNYFERGNLTVFCPWRKQIHQAKFLFPFSEKLSPMLERHGSFFLFSKKANRKLHSLILFPKNKIERSKGAIHFSKNVIES